MLQQSHSIVTLTDLSHNTTNLHLHCNFSVTHTNESDIRKRVERLYQYQGHVRHDRIATKQAGS